MRQDGMPYWVAVQVKPNHERTAALNFDVKGCEYFLPLCRSVRQWSDRKKELQRPLFPGYMFCRYEERARSAILKTTSVVRILGLGGEPEPVSDDEIAAVQRITSSSLDYQSIEYVRAGDRVYLNSGPLKGIEGLVIAANGDNCRLVVSVTLLGRSVAVQVNPSWLTLLQPGSHLAA